jgi:dolichyl-phosphate-mannose-protein mannosyltransferase
MRADETALPDPAHPADQAEEADPGHAGEHADKSGQADAGPAETAARPGAWSRPLHWMVPPMPGSAFWGWAGPLLVTAFGAFLRFNRLSIPRAVVFDETYYVGDAWAILRHGVEINHVKNANSLLVHGSTNILKGTQGELVAHPPLGKMMMAVGQWLFGLTPFGWRFIVALIGSLSILLLARIVRRMTRSTLLGCMAGLLLALDGLELVLSRTAILDIFVMFWVLAAFGLIVVDRDRTRARLAAAAAADPDPGRLDNGGPRLGARWPLLLAGVCLGCAMACKWNGAWYIVAFGALLITWDLGGRRAAGYGNRLAGVLRSDAPWLPVWFVVIPAVVYVASWSGWFATPYGYNRNGAALNHGHPAGTVAAWLAYNKWMLGFGLGLSSGQTYKSDPVGWLVLARPISFYYKAPPGCGVKSCSQEVLAIGTPLVWWAAAVALVFCLGWWLMRRDWRAGAALLGVAVGWAPWIWFYWHDHRTEFYYYVVTFEPFMIIAIVLCLGLIIGPERASPGRRALGAVAAGAYLMGVLANFAYLYPILAARVIPYSSWLSRMWFHSWI